MHEYKIRTLKGGTRTKTRTWTRPEACVEVTAYQPGDGRAPWWGADIHLQARGEATQTPRVTVFPSGEDVGPGFVTIEVGDGARRVTIYISPEQAASLKEQL